jgi:hypothetical protein
MGSGPGQCVTALYPDGLVTEVERVAVNGPRMACDGPGKDAF